jgi:hypothetical protein
MPGILGLSALIGTDQPAESIPSTGPLARTLNLYAVSVVRPTKLQVRGVVTAIQSDEVVGDVEAVTV